MDMQIDKARSEELATKIQHRLARFGRQRLSHRNDSVLFNPQISLGLNSIWQ
jgi:hypothetical protein